MQIYSASIYNLSPSNKSQAFSLTTDYRLIYERTGSCVSYKTNDTIIFLEMTDCSNITQPFHTEDKNGELYIKNIVKNDGLCVTPISIMNNFNVTIQPRLGDPLVLTSCDKVASRILPMEEAFFQEDRKLLKGVFVPPNSSCDFKACGFNKREPVVLLPSHQITRCTKLWECVTLAVKTARRPHLVVRLAKSVRDTLGFDLPIVAFDDGPNNYPDTVHQKIAEYPLLKYIVSNNEDLGISQGRNLAVLHVETKYFFLLDDDIKFNQYSALDKLVEILDTTDATVVSAVYMLGKGFTGYFRFSKDIKSKKRTMGIYHDACTFVNQTIPNHPDCVLCDISSNVFLARTKEILYVGGWDPELMIFEHRDIFIRLKAAGMKVVLCPDVRLDHARPLNLKNKGEHYAEKRQRSGKRFVFLYHVSLILDGCYAGNTELYNALSIVRIMPSKVKNNRIHDRETNLNFFIDIKLYDEMSRYLLSSQHIKNDWQEYQLRTILELVARDRPS